MGAAANGVPRNFSEGLPEKGRLNSSGMGGSCNPHRNYGLFSFNQFFLKQLDPISAKIGGGFIKPVQQQI